MQELIYFEKSLLPSALFQLVKYPSKIFFKYMEEIHLELKISEMVKRSPIDYAISVVPNVALL